MTKQVQRFDAENATAEALREEGRAVQGLADALMRMRSRGHFTSEIRADVLKLVVYLDGRASDLQASARLRDGPMKANIVS
jgi:hypothetical protein